MPNLRATVLLKCLFPMSGELGPFSAAKKSVPLQFPWPQLYSLFFFSSNTLMLLNFLFFLFFFFEGMRELVVVVVVGGLFLFPESTRHRSRAPYLISREENPSPQLLLIRVKWSQPTNSYRTLKKLLLPLLVSRALSLSVPSSVPLCAKFRLRGETGEGFCGVGTRRLWLLPPTPPTISA